MSNFQLHGRLHLISQTSPVTDAFAQQSTTETNAPLYHLGTSPQASQIRYVNSWQYLLWR